MFTAAQTTSVKPKTTTTPSAREIGSKLFSEKITTASRAAGPVTPKIEYEPSGRPIQSSEEAVIAGQVTTEQRAAERAAVSAFYKGESQAEVKRSATEAYRKSLGLPPSEVSTPFATKLASGGVVYSSDIYDPEYASLSDRATSEHVMTLAEEVGVPTKQPSTNAEKAAAMKARKELVARLEAEGISSGLAWQLARQASYNVQEPDRFKELYGVDAGESIKPFESERIMDELKALKAGLSAQSSTIADSWAKIQDKYKAAGEYYPDRGLVQAPISGGLPPGYRSADSLASEQLRQQFELLKAQSTYLGRYIKQAESGKRVSLTDAMKSIIAPESLQPRIPRTGKFSYLPPISGISQAIPQETTYAYIGSGKGTYQPPCVGGVCLPPSIMKQATTPLGRSDAFQNMLAGTTAGQPYTYQGIAGKDVTLYGETPYGAPSPIAKVATGKPVPAPKFAPGGFLAGQGLRPPPGQEFLKEAMTGGQAITYLRNKDLMKQEFAELSGIDKKAALGNARQELEIEWASQQSQPVDAKEKENWLTGIGYSYAMAAANARVQGESLTETKDEFLARASREYDTDVKQYYGSPANREAWVKENLASYEKELDTQIASGRLTLTDDSGKKVVFSGSLSDYMAYRTRQSGTLPEIGKEFGTSLIPVYGTYKYIKQASKDGFTRSEVGWSIASVAADIAMIVPPIGAAARASLKPALAGFTASSRIGNIVRSARTAASMFKVKPAIFRPSIKGITGGIKTLGKEYWQSLKYPFVHPIETVKGVSGLATGSRTFQPVPFGFKGTINDYITQQMSKQQQAARLALLKPGDIQPRTSVARYKQGVQLGTLKYEPVTPYTGVAEGPGPSGVIRQTVYPGTQGMRQTKTASGRTFLEWVEGVPSGEVVERIVLSPQQQAWMMGRKGASGLQFSPAQRWEYGMGISAETSGGLSLSPTQLAYLERYHFQPASFTHPSWLRIEPISDWSPYAGTMTGVMPKTPVVGGVAVSAPSTATMTIEQVAKRALPGILPTTWAVSEISPITQIAIRTIPSVPSMPSVPSIFPAIAPGIIPKVITASPIASSLWTSPFGQVSATPMPISSPYTAPSTLPASITPVITPTTVTTITTPQITPVIKPITPKPTIPKPIIPIPLIPGGLGGGGIGDDRGYIPQHLGYWEFGEMYAGVHPLTGKLMRVKSKRRIRYGNVPATVVRSRISGNTNSDTPYYKERYSA